ncbi:MAG: PAS domain S-box protein [Actinobacteria bacterium]|nr:PAS domain S-box protein [Actinomycetota bacterium]
MYLEGVLDEEVQAQRSLQGARSQETTQVLGRTQTLILLAFAVVLAALAAILFFGSGVAARVGGWMGYLARETGEAAGRLRRGDVGVERRLLPVGIALVALFWVAQSVLQAYVFERGGFLETLFPLRIEELLNRGLVAAALVAFLAYVQFVVNRRRQEEWRKQEDRRRRENEARLQLAAVVESSDDAIIGRSLDGVITSWNSGAEKLYGYTAEEVVGEYGFILVPPERSNELLKVLEKLRQRESVKTHETVHMDKNGRLIDVALTISQIRDSSGNTVGYSTIARDITERKKAEEALQESEEKYRMLVETVQEGFGIIDAQEKITYCNAAYAAIFEVAPQELVGRSLLEFVDQQGQRELLRQRALSGNGAGGSYEITITPRGGKRKHLSASATPVTDADGHFQGAVHAIIDITERKRDEERLAYMARYDHLTGLGNRVLFHDRLVEALARADRNNNPVALMFLDLDRFKAVNDTLGHASGDLLLKNVAERLRGCVREVDTVARMGGDEFSIILEDLSDGQDAALVAQKIIDALSRVIDLDGQEVFVTNSIGIATSPPSLGDDLVRDADVAMYHAKQSGRNNY